MLLITAAKPLYAVQLSTIYSCYGFKAGLSFGSSVMYVSISMRKQNMPTISMFYGILILMFFRDNRRHHLPHIHVRYQGEEAAISIDDGRLLDGTMPAKQLKMVQVWIEIHKEELQVDWELAVNGDEPFRIAPLQ